MYGAIPYLMQAFALDRETAFRVVCEWVDQQQAEAPARSEDTSPAPVTRPASASVPEDGPCRRLMYGGKPRNELRAGTTLALWRAAGFPFPVEAI